MNTTSTSNSLQRVCHVGGPAGRRKGGAGEGGYEHRVKGLPVTVGFWSKESRGKVKCGGVRSGQEVGNKQRMSFRSGSFS